MYKYITKSFTDIAEIDLWIRSFERPDRSASAGNAADIVGYVVLNNAIVITVRTWQPPS